MWETGATSACVCMSACPCTEGLCLVVLPLPSFFLPFPSLPFPSLPFPSLPSLLSIPSLPFIMGTRGLMTRGNRGADGSMPSRATGTAGLKASSVMQRRVAYACPSSSSTTKMMPLQSVSKLSPWTPSPTRCRKSPVLSLGRMLLLALSYLSLPSFAHL